MELSKFRDSKMNDTARAVQDSNYDRMSMECEKYKEILRLLSFTTSSEWDSASMVKSWKSSYDRNLIRENELVPKSDVWTSCLLYSGIAAVTVALIMFCAFRCFHGQKRQQWEIQRLQRLLRAQKGDLHAEVIMSAKRHHEEDERRKSMNHQQRAIKWAPESFNKMIQNSVGVQDALMEDVIDDMQTEGVHANDQSHDIPEGLLEQTQKNMNVE